VLEKDSGGILPEFEPLLQQRLPAFDQQRAAARAQTLALSSLPCLGRRAKWPANKKARAAKRLCAGATAVATTESIGDYDEWDVEMEKSMKRIDTTAIALSAVLLIASAAFAQVTLNSVRVGAKDTAALAKFYQTAFGMQEVNRIGTGEAAEIFVNFGATADAAKANKSLPIVIMHRDSDDLKDPIPHVILNVKDMAGTVAAIKAAGGSMAGDPRPFGNTGIVIGIAIDPAGNRLELIQRP
jgi:predicted enzyme related to lactoylglutathione lyase